MQSAVDDAVATDVALVLAFPEQVAGDVGSCGEGLGDDRGQLVLEAVEAAFLLAGVDDAGGLGDVQGPRSASSTNVSILYLIDLR